MILITGAAGKTGRALVSALHCGDINLNKETIRVLVRRPEQVKSMLELGVQEVIVGDLRSKKVLEQALTGVRIVYHIPPNVHPDEFIIAQLLIQAAQKITLERIVYHSVLHPQIEAMPHHWQKMRVEEMLFTTGIDCTILQPEVYMQNIFSQWATIAHGGVYSIPYSTKTRLGLVDLEDVAMAAAIVLTTDGHQGATYELAGPDVLDQDEVAGILAKVLKMHVKAQVQSRDDWSQRARQSGSGEYQISTLIKMFEYYESFGFFGNSKVLAQLLDREPAHFETAARRFMKSYL
jgi:NAD(P)H dehydrogenase (quinone)